MTMNKRIQHYFRTLMLAAGLLGFCTAGVQAQDVPTPAPAQNKPVLLTGGTIHPGNGQPAFQGDILIIGGKLVDVGAIRTRVTDAETFNVSGMHIYPGLIAPSTQIGIDEIGAVRATEDVREVGAINPNARTIIAYNTDSRVTPTIRSNGILLAQVAPRGNLFAGTSSIVQFDAWNWEDAAYKMDDGVHLYWPRLNYWEAWWAPPIEQQKKRTRENLQRVHKAMDDARAYLAAKEAKRLKAQDLRWEAMIPVLKKEIPVFVHAQTEKQIHSAIAFKVRHDVDIVLVGAADAWLVTDLLKQHKVPVILHKPQDLPRLQHDDIDQAYKTPKLLADAGVPFCLSMVSFWNQRNLPFQAGQAAAYGLSKAQALRAVTLSPAEILGIADRTGSLEPGKDANLVVSQGDLLDMRTSQVMHAFIQGRKIDLGNKQKDLAKKFSKKYGLE